VVQLAVKMGCTCVDRLTEGPHEEVQTPAVQVCPAVHARAQAPQLALSVWRLTQLPLHSVVPPAHEEVQTPAAHV